MPRNRETTQEAKTFVPKEDYEKIVEAAAAEGVTVAEFMRRALRDRLAAQGVEGARLEVKHGGGKAGSAEVLPMRTNLTNDEHSSLLCIDMAHTPEHTG